MSTAPRKKPRQIRSNVTVDAILESATRIFQRDGFARATTNRIAEYAGVSIGSLYQYFPNKVSLLQSLHDRRMKELMTDMAGACRKNRSDLRRAIGAIIESAARHHARNARLIGLTKRHLPPNEAPSTPLTAEFHAELKSLLARHRTKLRVQDPEFALFFLRTLGRSVMQSAAVDRRDDLAVGTIKAEVTAAALNFLLAKKPSSKRGRSGSPPRCRDR